MLKEFLKYYLDLKDLTDRVNALEKQKADQKQLDNVRSRLRELEPITVDLTNRERELLELFLNNSSEYINTSTMGEYLNTSRNNANSILNNLKDKIDLDVKTVEHNKKLYKLPEKEKERIFKNKV